MAILEKLRAAKRPPALQPGDVLTRVEFERRYEAMADLKKAELIDCGYAEVPAAAEGCLVSPGFPGLVIDTAALTSGDLAAALARLE